MIKRSTLVSIVLLLALLLTPLLMADGGFLSGGIAGMGGGPLTGGANWMG